jgi:hypothetical protein
LAAAGPFVRGTRFGTVGADYRFSAGDLYYTTYDSDYVKLDPVFRAGIAVLPSLAVGAELALFNTFPDSDDIFTNTPVFAFGPAAVYYPIPGACIVQPYLSAGAGATYAFVWNRLGWRARLGVGVAVVSPWSVALALEGGWYGDWGQYPRWNSGKHRVDLTWTNGSTWTAGVRVIGFKR